MLSLGKEVDQYGSPMLAAVEVKQAFRTAIIPYLLHLSLTAAIMKMLVYSVQVCISVESEIFYITYDLLKL